MEKHPLHLKTPELQKSEEVARAVEHQEQHTGEKIPNDPSGRIESYMDRLENIFLNPDEHVRERNLGMFRDKIYDKFIIKKENFPESYFELQQRIARERGQAVTEIPQNVREQIMDVAIQDQKHSLDAWMNYLTSNDAMYPPWFKYYAWNQITKLSQFDKERSEFKKRTESTVAPFPDIYREPLAQIADLYQKVKDNNKDPEARREFDKKFPALYAELTQKSLAASMENREETRGVWVRYNQGEQGAAQKLYESLEGKGTGWCTAGLSTAEQQIESGDFYVYYTNDSKGNPANPRLAIRMDGTQKISEVRGVLSHQNVEPLLQEILDEKLKEFGSEADAYRKKSEDMKRMTLLNEKHKRGEAFTKEDLQFLYEINGVVEGFGYEKDPRIAELLSGRNIGEDMLAVFECTRDQIAHVSNEITSATRAYVGHLESDIFKKLPATCDYIYTSFPDKRIYKRTAEVGGKSAEELVLQLEAGGIVLQKHIRRTFELNKELFNPAINSKDITFIDLTVEDLGFKTNVTLSQVYERAQYLGLELCPVYAGPAYFLKYKDSVLLRGNVIDVGMNSIVDPRGRFLKFCLIQWSDELELDEGWGELGEEIKANEAFIFCLPGSEA